MNLIKGLSFDLYCFGLKWCILYKDKRGFFFWKKELIFVCMVEYVCYFYFKVREKKIGYENFLILMLNFKSLIF